MARVLFKSELTTCEIVLGQCLLCLLFKGVLHVGRSQLFVAARSTFAHFAIAVTLRPLLEGMNVGLSLSWTPYDHAGGCWQRYIASFMRRRELWDGGNPSA